MKKIAVFVEGQTELILIRELLLRMYAWNVDLKCLSLYRKGQYKECPYPNKIDNASYHYTIYNVGSDTSVLSEILLHEHRLFELGFERIVGLRDMYSKEYRNISNKIDESINQKFIDGFAKSIKNSINPEKIYFNFSIMEVEAWILAISHVFEKIDSSLTIERISELLSIDLKEIDPEKEVFHPASLVADILNIAGKKYDKKLGDVENFCKHFEDKDYNDLYTSYKCMSFNNLYDSLKLVS